MSEIEKQRGGETKNNRERNSPPIDPTYYFIFQDQLKWMIIAFGMLVASMVVLAMYKIISPDSVTFLFGNIVGYIPGALPNLFIGTKELFHKHKEKTDGKKVNLEPWFLNIRYHEQFVILIIVLLSILGATVVLAIFKVFDSNTTAFVFGTAAGYIGGSMRTLIITEKD